MNKVKTEISANMSQTLATARIWCLLSIVAAHVAYEGTFAGAFWNRLGTIGVVLYLFMAGYLYNPSRFDNVGILIKKKFLSIGVPWLCCGTLVWVYNAILSTKFRSLIGYIRWMCGNGTYLYYIPIIFACFLVFYKAQKWAYYIAISLNVISIIVTAAGVMDSTVAFLGINHYLNPFNWFGFFALGMLTRGVDSEKIYAFLRKFGWMFLGLFISAFAVLMIFAEIRFDYFSYVAIPYELIGGLAVLSISTFKITRYSVFNNLSTFTFSIYLTHIIFLGLLDAVFSGYEVMRMILPLGVIAASFFVLAFGRFLSRKLHIEKVYSLLVGGRA